MLPVRLKDCKGVEGAVLVARSQIAVSFTSWQMVRLDDQPGRPITFDFAGRGAIDGYWSTERPDTLRITGPGGRQWTWSGLTFEFGDGVVRCTLIGPPEEEQ